MPHQSVERMATAWFAELVGERVWSATVWRGSMVDLDMGAPRRHRNPGRLTGERQLWLQGAEWAILRDGDVVATSDDDTSRMQAGFDQVLGARIVDVHHHAPDAFCLVFSNDLALRVRPARDDEAEDWELLRCHKTLTARGGVLTLDADDAPPDDEPGVSDADVPADAPGADAPGADSQRLDTRPEPAAATGSAADDSFPGLVLRNSGNSGIVLHIDPVMLDDPGASAVDTSDASVHLLLEGRVVCGWAPADSAQALEALGDLEGREAPASVVADRRTESRTRWRLLTDDPTVADRLLLDEPPLATTAQLYLFTHGDRVTLLVHTPDHEVFSVDGPRQAHLAMVFRAQALWRRLVGDPDASDNGADEEEAGRR